MMDIKLFISDVDSTLTDGKYYVFNDGKLAKSFFSRDFYALGELVKNKIKVMFATSSKSEIIYHKVSNLWYGSEVEILWGTEDKKAGIDFFLDNLNITWDNVAYIGDAENDIECIEKAVFSCCPNDAIPEIKEKVDFVSSYDGGNGAVWEFAKEILKMVKANRL